MKKLLSLGFAAAFGVLSMTAMVATAHAFDYGHDDDGEEDPFDFAHEMATGGYQELVEGFENGEFNPPFDYESEDEDEDEDE